MFVRNPNNPLIMPQDVSPSRPGFEVIGVFNAGVAEYNGEILLLLRVAERPVAADKNTLLCPHLAPDGELVITRVAKDDPAWDTHDSRAIGNLNTGDIYLTSISHLRLARSSDGVHFTIDPQPWLWPQPPYETFGAEDARITRIDDTYYINYGAISEHGIATALASTTDFVQVRRHGLIFAPANRDVTLFPQQINGLYTCYHRPMPGGFGGLHIWLATSPDLVHWGGHRIVLQTERDSWDGGRLGGGAPPLWTEQGWLSIYHAADRNQRYCLGALLAAHDDPGRVLAYSKQPIMSPEAPYEIEGFFGNVVFTCGALLKDSTVQVYYGASDDTIALAEAPLQAILDSLTAL